MPCELECVKFEGVYSMTEFFENNFSDFLDEVQGKIILISSSCGWRLVTATSLFQNFQCC